MDEFGGEIVHDSQSSVLNKVGNVLKSAGLGALKFVDWASHLGQPQVAKDLVQAIATDTKSAPQNPEQAGRKPGFLESMGQVMPGQGIPTMPPGLDIRPAASTAVDMATSPSTYLSLGLSGVSKIPWMASMLSKAGKAPEMAAAALGSKLTHIPGEALSEASTAAGRAGMATAAQGAGGAGSKLADALANFEKTMPERAIVDKALKAAGPIEMQSAIDALETAKSGIPTKSGITSQSGDLVISKIEDMIGRLKKGGPKLDAEEYRKVRQLLDEDIDWNQTWAKPYSEALAKARTAMKNEMISATPPEYADAMKSWHDKIDLADEMKSLMGKEEGARQDIRAGSFLNQTAKEAKGGPRRALLERFDQAAGSKFLDEGELRKLALEFGPEGAPSWMPQQHPVTMMGEAAAAAGLGHFSGHPALAALAPFAVAGSSPALAARAINASRLPPYLLRLAAENSPALSAAGAASAHLPPYLQRPQ